MEGVWRRRFTWLMSYSRSFGPMELLVVALLVLVTIWQIGWFLGVPFGLAAGYVVVYALRVLKQQRAGQRRSKREFRG